MGSNKAELIEGLWAQGKTENEIAYILNMERMDVREYLDGCDKDE